MSTTSVLRAVALATFLACGMAGGAQAAAAQAQGVTKVAEAGTEAHPATGAEEDGASCNRVRRRLWVEGEGWIVRRITTCR